MTIKEMIKIETNTDVRQKRIDSEVQRVIDECTEIAKQGGSYCYIRIDRDIQRDVRDILKEKTNIFVCINHGVFPSKNCVEYYDNIAEIKFTWS